MLELITFAVAFLAVSCVWYYWKHPKNMPPGPVGFPLLGSIPYMRRNQTLEILEEWRNRYGKIFSFYMAETPVVVLAELDVIKDALIRQSDVFSERPMLGLRAVHQGEGRQQGSNLGLVMSNGELWKEQRRFALATLRDFGFGRPILQRKIHDELDPFLEEFRRQRGKSFDPTLIINNAVSNVTCNLSFGTRFDYTDEKFRLILEKTNFRLAGSNFNFLSPLIYMSWALKLPFIRDFYLKFQREGDAILDFVENLIVEHEKNYSEQEEPSDYIHAFIKARNSQQGKFFFDEQLLFSVMSLFLAGTETTSTTLRWALLFMASHPEVQEKVFKEIRDSVGLESLPSVEEKSRLPYTEAVIMEIQRVANIAPLSVAHSTNADATVCGYHIPRGSTVIPYLYAVHKDPRYFPEPDEFRPERFLDEAGKPQKLDAFVPFSIGKRLCLGESLAKMELYLFFTALVQKFEFRFSEDKPRPDLGACVLGITRSPQPFGICAVERR